MGFKPVSEFVTVKNCACGARAAVADSRPQENMFRRRYKCPKCGARWTTLEVMAEAESADWNQGGIVPRDWSRKPTNEDR